MDSDKTNVPWFRRPPCSANCWHYGSFGGTEGCEYLAGDYGGWPEQIKPDEKCLYPEKREIHEPIVISSQGMCAALEGAVIKGGPHDNTTFVQMLTNPRGQNTKKT